MTKMSRNSARTHLLILDRKEDPVTPLLNQWTYQAMVHELLGINSNRVDLKHLDHLAPEMREVVLSSDDDHFFRSIMFKNYGEVAEEIHTLVQKFLSNKKSQAQFKSIEDMQRVIENFPEFKKSERNTTKHFNILEELRRLIEGRSLYKISEVEQDLSSSESSNSKGDNYRKVCNIVESDDFSKVEKLRLLILFSIRYENDNMIFQLKEKMRGQGISEEQLNLVNCMLEYAGKN